MLVSQLYCDHYLTSLKYVCSLVKCMQRWEKGLRPGIIKGRWTEEEDRMLVYLVSQGHKNWGKVAQHMPGRTSKQCRERWNNYLDPTLIHTPFTEEEDELLVRLQSEHGNKWAQISRHMPGRTENAVKLRYNSLKKRLGGSIVNTSAGTSAGGDASALVTSASVVLPSGAVPIVMVGTPAAPGTVGLDSLPVPPVPPSAAAKSKKSKNSGDASRPGKR